MNQRVLPAFLDKPSGSGTPCNQDCPTAGGSLRLHGVAHMQVADPSGKGGACQGGSRICTQGRHPAVSGMHALITHEWWPLQLLWVRHVLSTKASGPCLHARSTIDMQHDSGLPSRCSAFLQFWSIQRPDGGARGAARRKGAGRGGGGSRGSRAGGARADRGAAPGGCDTSHCAPHRLLPRTHECMRCRRTHNVELLIPWGVTCDIKAQLQTQIVSVDDWAFGRPAGGSSRGERGGAPGGAAGADGRQAGGGGAAACRAPGRR